MEGHLPNRPIRVTLDYEVTMPDWTHFPNAPIVEAILDVRATLPPDVDLARLASLHDALKDDYPFIAERVSWRNELQLHSNGSYNPGSSRVGPDGYFLRARDGRQAVIFSLDGFTFSRQRPYENWTTFFTSAWSMWEQYRQAVVPRSVSRLGLRYINRLPLPLPFADFREYVLTTPEVAPALPQGLMGFFLRLVLPMEALDCVAVVSETMENPEGSVLPFILDIDVFRVGSFRPDSAEIPVVFDQLREAKNTIFFNSITGKARELFK